MDWRSPLVERSISGGKTLTSAGGGPLTMASNPVAEDLPLIRNQPPTAHSATAAAMARGLTGNRRPVVEGGAGDSPAAGGGASAGMVEASSAGDGVTWARSASSVPPGDSPDRKSVV